MGQAKRTYKDGLFRFYMREPENSHALCQAFTDMDLAPEDVRECTLESVLFHSRRNDLSLFLRNQLFAFFEHQSTQNENMPVRMLLYLAAVYQSILPEDFLYRAKMFPCPAPRFFMLYNGKESFPEKKTMRLSDAFPMTGDAELTVTAYNIVYSKENKLLQSCRPLHDYSLFIHRVDENKGQGMALEQAILKAIADCRADGIMADFLERHHGEVFEMVSLKWDEEKAKEFYESEARAEGIDFAIVNSIRNLMETVGWTAQQAMDALKIPVTEQARYAALL
ncbi:MAG: Rpn family recombination-promoting nuclease/putative transposase [Selenomonadaceae bacterium]|nr:Rpn family recombination-promoting nuclease/putative transposase [Selenomonadaceae bacterium]